MPTRKQINSIWNKAKKVRGKDPAKYRKDAYGNTLYKASYGKDSPMGWQADHIKPKSRGGSNTTRNLQVLNSRVNKSKGASRVKRSRHSR